MGVIGAVRKIDSSMISTFLEYFLRLDDRNYLSLYTTFGARYLSAKVTLYVEAKVSVWDQDKGRRQSDGENKPRK